MLRLILPLWLALLSSAPLLALTTPQPVLVLGDSLSAGYGIEPESGWVSLLRERLQKDNPAREVVNASISGETTAGGLARIDALLTDHRPALVVLELGANDALRGLPLSAPRHNLTRIIELSRKAGARVVLVGIEIPVNYGVQYRDGLRNLYRDLAAEFKLPLVPFLLDGVALDSRLMQPDGLHPTAAAQPRVLANVLPALEKALKP
jgi:acyl-CoA thioesterase-1